MKKPRKTLNLFYNNKFLFVFSVAAAVAIWLVVAVEFSPETTNIIKNVPVDIDYTKIQEKLGLAAFGETKFTVDVTVSGKKYIVESDDIIDDISVAANTGYVNSPGTYSLKLDVASESARPLYSVEETSTDEIDVYFDYPKEKEFAVEPSVEFVEDAVPDGYCVGKCFLETDAVGIYGPETEVNKITGVVARATVDGELRQSRTLDASLVALTRDGSAPKHIVFNRKSEIMRLTIPVYKIAELPAECNFTNKPSNYIEKLPFTVNISPPSARFGVPAGKLEGEKAFEIASINFSKINVGINRFVVKAEDITGGMILDGTKEFVVTVDASKMFSKTVPAPSSTIFINVPSGAKPELVKLNFTDATIIGPRPSLDEMNFQDITLSIDLNSVDKDASGVVVAPATITDADCWSFGEYYATVKITR